MTDLTARHDNLPRQTTELDLAGATERDQLPKKLLILIANQIWELAEETAEMDTQPFKGLL
jgi:hypothetical protein